MVVSPSAKSTVTVVKQPTRIAPARIAPAPMQLQTIAPTTGVSSGSQKVLIRQVGNVIIGCKNVSYCRE